MGGSNGGDGGVGDGGFDDGLREWHSNGSGPLENGMLNTRVPDEQLTALSVIYAV